MRLIVSILLIIVVLHCQGQSRFYKIPVVIHLLYQDSTQLQTILGLQSIVDNLNKDFSLSSPDTSLIDVSWHGLIGKSKIQFVLAERTLSLTPSLGINYVYVGQQLFSNHEQYKKTASGGQDPWDTDKYLNIWICALDSSDNGSSIGVWDPQSIQGVVINRLSLLQNPSRALTKLIGHYLGLKDLNEGGSCSGSSEKSCITEGDGICDTPPSILDPLACYDTQSNTCVEDHDQADMHSNFMSEVKDSCRLFFTKDQVLYMEDHVRLFHKDKINNAFGIEPIVNLNLRLFDLSIQNNICLDSFEVYYYIQNMGTDTIFSYVVENSLGTQQSNPYLFSDTLLPYEIDSVYFSIQNINTGKLNFQANISSVNGFADNYLDNDTMRISLLKLNPNDQSSINLNFESEQDWESISYINPDNKMQWQSSFTLAGRDSLPTRCLMLNHFRYSGDGELDAFVTPRIHLTNLDSPKLYFDIAYAKYSSANYERLKVYMHSDCNADTVLYNKAGSALQTNTSSQTEDWYPSPLDWKTRSLDLRSFIGDTIYFRFEVENGYGNNLFIDNIIVKDSIYINTVPKINFAEINIYPNPVKDILNIKWPDNFYFQSMSLFDSKSALLWTTYEQRDILDFSSLNEGLYLLKMQSKYYSKELKIIHIKK